MPSRRWVGSVPRLTKRAWEDAARNLEEFLKRVWSSESGGIPSGFEDKVPAVVEAEVGGDVGAPGSENEGWAAANHKHVASTGVPLAVGLEQPVGEGSAPSLARSDHRHEVEVFRAVGLTLDGGASVVTTGFKGFQVSPFSGTVVGWVLRGEPAGSCTFDVWKSWRTPGPADTICGAAKPALVAQAQASGGTTGWSNLAVTKGEIFGFNVDAATTVTLVTLVVRVKEAA